MCVCMYVYRLCDESHSIEHLGTRLGKSSSAVNRAPKAKR